MPALQECSGAVLPGMPYSDATFRPLKGGIRLVGDGSIPLRFQGGVAAPLIKKGPVPCGADGVVVKRSRSLLIDIRVAHLILLEFTNHPVCAAEEGTFLLKRSHPSFKTEGNELASTAIIDFEIADAHAHHIHSFATCGTGLILTKS